VNWELVGPEWQLRATTATKPRARAVEGTTKTALARLHGGRREQQVQPCWWLLVVQRDAGARRRWAAAAADAEGSGDTYHGDEVAASDRPGQDGCVFKGAWRRWFDRRMASTCPATSDRQARAEVRRSTGGTQRQPSFWINTSPNENSLVKIAKNWEKFQENSWRKKV
jgi:hypothetical protein